MFGFISRQQLAQAVQSIPAQHAPGGLKDVLVDPVWFQITPSLQEVAKP
jgi:hypothetical protein